MTIKLKDLLESLQKLSESELNRPLYVYADHGQTYSQAFQMGFERLVEDCGEVIGLDETDYDDYDDWTDAFVIDGV